MQDLRRKKRKTHTYTKKLYRGQKLVGSNERVFCDIHPREIFFAVLKPWLNETAFYIKLSGRFSGPKTKVT